MDKKQTFNIRVLNYPRKKWYWANTKFTIRGTINFYDEKFEIYYPIKTITIEKIDSISIERTGIFGIEKWIKISYCKEEKEMDIWILYSLFDKSISKIISHLKQYIPKDASTI